MQSQREMYAYKKLETIFSGIDQSMQKSVRFVVANQLLEGLYPDEDTLELLVEIASGKRDEREVLQETIAQYAS